MEPSMTNNPDALLPSAKDVRQRIALAEAEEAEKQARMRAEAQAEKRALVDQLSKPLGILDEEAIKRGIQIIERAVHNRMTEVEVIRFPNQLCTDRGRAIVQQEPGWEQTLTGAPKEIYQWWEKYFRPRGYKLKAQVVDYPDGVPGDIGMTLSW
jgi:chromosome condensin MukBEF ATPase and DNA-binding subunit MukB